MRPNLRCYSRTSGLAEPDNTPPTFRVSICTLGIEV